MLSVFQTPTFFLKINKICREVFGEMEKIFKGVLPINSEYKKNWRKSIERAGAAENKIRLACISLRGISVGNRRVGSYGLTIPATHS